MADVRHDSAVGAYDVSVVVPMYNVERFLPQCVESLLSQTLGERLQIVLVDDGSPDASGALGDDYAAQHENVICVHRDNGGLGPARNTGTTYAQGRYIGFVDSDDWVDSYMYERLYAIAISSDADVVFSGMRTVAAGVEIQSFPQPYGNSIFDCKEDVAQFRRTFFGAAPAKVVMEPMQVSVCPAIYRSSVIREYGIAFENIRSEDLTFNLDFLAHVSRIACVNGIFYNYRKDDQASITKTFRVETVTEYFELFEKISTRLPEKDELGYQDAAVRFDRRVIDCCRGMLVSVYSSLDEGECDTVVERILASDRLRSAVRGYPWYRVPLAQGVFLLAMKHGCKKALRVLSALRSGR